MTRNTTILSALAGVLILLFSTGSVYVLSVFFHGTVTGTRVHPLFLILVVLFTSLAVFKAWKNKKAAGSLFLRKRIIGFLPLFTFLLWASLKSPEGLGGDPSTGMVLVFYVAVYAILLIYTAGMLIVFTYTSIPAADKPTGRWKIGIYALIPLVFWAFYLIAYYPATMTPDSFAHWHQIHTLDFDNWHPVVYTWFILALTTLWHSPAVVAISHIIIMALISGYGAYSIEKKGGRPVWISAGMILFSIYPLTGAFTVAIWKDVLYSGLLILLTIIAYRIASTKGAWLSSNGRLLFFTVVALAVSLMRSNGLPIFIVTGLCLLLMYRSYMWRLLTSIGSVIVLYLLLIGPLFSYMDVDPSNPNEALAIPTQQFAHIINEDGELTQEQRQYLNDIMAFRHWEEFYNPYLTDPIKFSGYYDQTVVFADFPYYLKIWAEVVSQNFGLAVEAYLDQTSVLWQINQPEDGYTSTYANNIYLFNDYDLQRDPLSDGVYEYIQHNLEKFNENWLEPFLRPAFYTALLLLMGTALTVKSGKRFAVILLPILLNTLTMLLAAPAQDFRYQYSNVLLTFLMAGYVLLKFDDTTERDE